MLVAEENRTVQREQVWRGHTLVAGRRPGPAWLTPPTGGPGWVLVDDDGTKASWAPDPMGYRWVLHVVAPAPLVAEVEPEPSRRSLAELCAAGLGNLDEDEARRLRAAMDVGLVEVVRPSAAPVGQGWCMADLDEEARMAALRRLDADLDANPPTPAAEVAREALSGPEWGEGERRWLLSGEMVETRSAGAREVPWSGAR